MLLPAFAKQMFILCTDLWEKEKSGSGYS